MAKFVVREQSSLRATHEVHKGLSVTLHWVVKNQAFSIALGLRHGHDDEQTGVTSFDQMRLKVSLCFFGDSQTADLKAVDFNSQPPIEIAIHPHDNHNYRSFDVIEWRVIQIKPKVLSSKFEDAVFVVKIDGHALDSDALLPGCSIVSEPIKVVSKPDVARGVSGQQKLQHGHASNGSKRLTIRGATAVNLLGHNSNTNLTRVHSPTPVESPDSPPTTAPHQLPALSQTHVHTQDLEQEIRESQKEILEHLRQIKFQLALTATSSVGSSDVHLRLSSDDMLYHSSQFQVGAGGEALLEFSPSANPSGSMIKLAPSRDTMLSGKRIKRCFQDTTAETSPPMSDAFSLERGWSVVLGALSKIPTGDRSQKLRKLFDEALQGDRFSLASEVINTAASMTSAPVGFTPGGLSSSSSSILTPPDHDDAKCPYFQYWAELNANMSNELMVGLDPLSVSSCNGVGRDSSSAHANISPFVSLG